MVVTLTVWCCPRDSPNQLLELKQRLREAGDSPGVSLLCLCKLSSYIWTMYRRQRYHRCEYSWQIQHGRWQVYTSIEMAGRSSTGEQLSIVIQTYFSKKSGLNEASETSLPWYEMVSTNVLENWSRVARPSLPREGLDYLKTSSCSCYYYYCIFVQTLLKLNWFVRQDHRQTVTSYLPRYLQWL